MLIRTVPRTEPRRTLLVTGYQSDVALFTTILWALPSSQFITQNSMNLLISQLDNLSRRMLWGAVPKALLKWRKITSTAILSSTKWVTSSQKEIKLLGQNFPFMNPCWLCLIIALSFNCLSISIEYLGLSQSQWSSLQNVMWYDQAFLNSLLFRKPSLRAESTGSCLLQYVFHGILLQSPWKQWQLMRASSATDAPFSPGTVTPLCHCVNDCKLVHVKKKQGVDKGMALSSSHSGHQHRFTKWFTEH